MSARPTAVSLETLRNLPAVVQRLDGDIVPVANGGAALSLKSGIVVIMPIMAPLPIGSVSHDRLQEACWPDWRTAASAWTSHVIISTIGNTKSPRGRREIIEDMLAIAIEFGEHFGANGLGWESSRLFLPFAAARNAIADSPLPPPLLVRTVPTAQGTITQGLHGFSLPEVRDRTKAADPRSSTIRLWNFASYLMEHGLVTRDGDTAGADQQPAYRVRHAHLPDGQPMLELLDC